MNAYFLEILNIVTMETETILVEATNMMEAVEQTKQKIGFLEEIVAYEKAVF